MKTKLLGAFLFLSCITSCKDPDSKNSDPKNDSTQNGKLVSIKLPDKPGADWIDPFFPRFCVTPDEFEKMKENFLGGCDPEKCEMEMASYLFDQLASIQFVHQNEITEVRGRYGIDGSDEARYRRTRGICEDNESGKVSGYSTILYSIESKNEVTMGKKFFYDLATICPPPHLSCIPSQPGDSTAH